MLIRPPKQKINHGLIFLDYSENPLSNSFIYWTNSFDIMNSNRKKDIPARSLWMDIPVASRYLDAYIKISAIFLTRLQFYHKIKINIYDQNGANLCQSVRHDFSDELRVLNLIRFDLYTTICKSERITVGSSASYCKVQIKTIEIDEEEFSATSSPDLTITIYIGQNFDLYGDHSRLSTVVESYKAYRRMCFVDDYSETEKIGAKLLMNYLSIYNNRLSSKSAWIDILIGKGEINMFEIKDIKFSNMATVVLWEDGTKTVVAMGDDEDKYDVEKAIFAAFTKKALSTFSTSKERSIDNLLDKVNEFYKKSEENEKKKKEKQAKKAAKKKEVKGHWDIF